MPRRPRRSLRASRRRRTRRSRRSPRRRSRRRATRRPRRRSTKADAKVEPAPPAEPAAPAIPTTRPKTLAEARDHLAAIAQAGDAAALAKLAAADATRIATSHQHESYLQLGDDARLVASFSGEKFHPHHYIGALVEDGKGNAKIADQLKLDEKANAVRYEPDGQFTVTFVFEKKGDELVLASIDTYDEEP
jgi:hypothetical protein